MMTEKMITLNNGVEIPQLALGTWLIDDNKVAEPVKTAIRLGYRHVDTAQAYANEVICCELQMSDILANVVNLAGFYIC